MSDDVLALSLKGVPWYTQGDHDGLCAYYSSAMMLATLFPQYDLTNSFGSGSGEVRRKRLFTDDPLIKYLSDSSKDKAVAIASWFHDGNTLERCAEILNRVARNTHGLSNPFQYASKYPKMGNNREHLYREIREALLSGFPVMLGWNSEDFGDHAVVAVGFSHIHKLNWLELHDPGGSSSIVWDNLVESSSGVIDLIKVDVNAFDGPRPDRWLKTKHGEKIERYGWTPDGHEGWHDRTELFKTTAQWHREKKRTPVHRVIDALSAKTSERLLKSEIVAIADLDSSSDEWDSILSELRTRELLVEEGIGKGKRYGLKDRDSSA